jgi:hypothetical protein
LITIIHLKFEVNKTKPLYLFYLSNEGEAGRTDIRALVNLGNLN